MEKLNKLLRKFKQFLKELKKELQLYAREARNVR